MKTAEEKATALELRRQGLTYKEIAQTLKVSASWVRNVCAQAGMDGHYATQLLAIKIKEYKASGHTTRETAKEFGISKQTAQRYCGGIAPQHSHINQNTKRTDDEARRYVESFMGDAFTYVGGYIDCEHKVTVKCNKCGHIFERSMVSIRHRVATCDNCKRISEEAKIRERLFIRAEQKKAAEENKIAKEIDRLQRTRVVICEECGRVFTTLRKGQSCCSPECGKKRQNRISSHRKDSRIKPEQRIDKNITAKKLYERDGGVCWICGGMCDLNDYTKRNGTIICGENYPSIDHVIPVCDGGRDAWDNVRLAHRSCNTKRFHSPQ